MHPVESILKAATVDGTEDELAIAGEGAPLVAEFCVAELALALGMSTGAGKRYLGDAVETRYRLPRLWKRVIAARCRCGRPARSRPARSSCPPTLPGSSTSTSHPSRTGAPTRRSTGPSTTPATSTTPKKQKPSEPRPAEHRGVAVRLGDVTIDGQVYIEATTDLADALALEAAVSAKAHDLLEEFPHLSLDVRRSMALGRLGNADGGKELVIYAHHDVSSPDGLVRIENTGSWITVEQLGEWCEDSKQQGDDPAGPRPQRAPAHRRLQAHPVAARAGHRDPPDLRLPALQQTFKVLRPRPHHRMAARPDRQPEPRATVPTTPPPQDPRRLDLPTTRTHHLPLAQPPRPDPPPKKLTPHTPPPAGPSACPPAR